MTKLDAMVSSRLSRRDKRFVNQLCRLVSVYILYCELAYNERAIRRLDGDYIELWLSCAYTIGAFLQIPFEYTENNCKYGVHGSRREDLNQLVFLHDGKMHYILNEIFGDSNV